MAGVLDAIGLVSGALGIISFLEDNLAPQPSDPGAAVKLKAGYWPVDQDGHDASPDEAGSVDAIYAYDNSNIYQGSGDGGHLDAGGTLDSVISVDVSGRQTKYISISGTDDAVCLAWITVTQNDGTRGGVWTGDIGSECDQKWYYNNERAGSVNDSSGDASDYIPNCTWLDANHGVTDNGALKFDLTAYGQNLNDVIDAGTGCDWTVYSPDADPIDDPVGKKKRRSTSASHRADVRKRASSTRPDWMNNYVVKSNISSHDTQKLCESKTSTGPDFLGPDGMFCDMETHTLHPVCSNKMVKGCVTLDKDNKVVTKRTTVQKREVDQIHKKYKTVREW